jgi:hypothetical protein
MPKDDMNDDERIAVGILQGVTFFIILMAMLLLCALFGSCTTERVVTVEKVRTDTVWQNHTARDSIFVHDSVHVKEKGDTVWIEKWKTVWQNHTARDSIYIHKTDSVPVPYPVVKEVEKPLTATQKGLMGVGLLAVMVGVVWVAWRLKRWLP